MVSVGNNATVTGGVNAVTGSTTGQFVLDNTGVFNGAVNVTGSIVGGSFLTNSGTWNNGVFNSTFSGSLISSGTVNALNGVGGQTINFAGTYSGAGAVRVDLGDRLQLGGTANLTGGSLNAAFAPNSGLAHSFVVLSAAGGLGGTTFATTTVTFPNATTSVTYTANDVVVNILSAQLGNGSNLNQNQQNVANPINNFFNAGGNLPAGFSGLFALTGAPLGNALTQLSARSRPACAGGEPVDGSVPQCHARSVRDGPQRQQRVGAPMGYARSLRRRGSKPRRARRSPPTCR